MSLLAIRVGRLLTPVEDWRDGILLIEDGRIVAAGPREAVALRAGTREYDASHWTAAPGFVDMHIHGAGGHDVMEPSPEAVGRVATTVTRFGTTTFLATTVTASPEDTCRSLEILASAARRGPVGANGAPAAELAGIHFEGPFISPARRGVHPPEWIAAPSLPLLERLLGAAGDAARVLTLAPELPGALALVDRAKAAGLVPAMGHTNATYEEAIAAIERGACHGVHVFNAMRPFVHRDTGVIGAVLTRPEVTAEIIADGVHVDAPAIEILLASKGIDGVILVSDGTAATGMPDGNYRLGTFEVTVSAGVCRDDAGHLAGSTLTLDRAVRNLVALGVPLADALRMATLNPARRLGLENRKGHLAPGLDADVVFLDESLHVAAIMTHTTPEPTTIRKS